MAFLTIFGNTIPVANRGGNQLTTNVSGDFDWAFNGEQIDQRRNSNPILGFTMPPNQTQAEALFYEGLVSGDYSHISFDDSTFWSHDGYDWSSVVGTAALGGGAGVFSSADYLSLPASADSISWDLDLDDDFGWWVMMHVDVAGGGYDWYGLASDGAKFKNGATTLDTLIFSVTSGILTVTNPNASARSVDDIVAFRFPVPSTGTHRTDLYTNWHDDTIWNKFLQVAGDAFNEGTISCEGVSRGRSVQGMSVAGTWTTNNEDLAFALRKKT